MRQYLALAAATLGLASPCLAQTPTQEWIAQYNGPANHQDAPTRMALGKGGLFIAGRSYEGSTRDDITLLRYTRDGDLVWARHYDGPTSGSEIASDLLLDGEGGAFVCAHSSAGGIWEVALLHYDRDGTLDWEERFPLTGSTFRDFDPRLALVPDGSLRIGYTTNSNFAVRAYAADRHLLWTREIDILPGEMDVLSSIAVDDLGNTAIVGAPGFGSNGFQTVMLDGDGNTLWSDNEFGSFGAVLGPGFVRFDANGDVVVAATSESTCGLHQTRVWRLSPTGDRLWTRIFSDEPCDLGIAEDMELDSEGNAVVLCQALLRNGQNSYNFLTIKYDPMGNELWRQTHSLPFVDIPTALAIDHRDNVYITGSNSGGATGYDSVTACYSPAGALRWSTIFDSGATDDRPADIVVDNRGNVYTTQTAFLPPNNNDILTIKLRPVLHSAAPRQ